MGASEGLRAGTAIPHPGRDIVANTGAQEEPTTWITAYL